jgi:hypothetical protein
VKPSTLIKRTLWSRKITDVPAARSDVWLSV